MAKPEAGPLAADLYESLGFHQDRDAELDFPLLRFCIAWASPLEAVYEIVRDRDDGRPGWAILLDPDECPAASLPYLAQFVGAQLQPGWTEAQKRAEIKAPTTWRRGQPETYKTAIQATLTGTQKVVVRERTPEPHDLYVRVLAAEAPTPARTEAVARAAKVAGLVLDFALFEGLTYADLNAGFESYGDVDAAFATYGELLESSLPE